MLPCGKILEVVQAWYKRNMAKSETHIYIYTRNAWVLPRRCSVYMSHSRTNDVANYHNSYGNKNTGTRDYQTNKVKTPEIPMGKTKTA